MARQIEAGDFDFFDYILVMDNFNLNVVHSMVDETYRSKIHLFLDYAELNEYKEVPDPYYGGEGGFEIVLDLLEQASIGLIKHLQSN
jgi:protein-tyrosine phosphatase